MSIVYTADQASVINRIDVDSGAITSVIGPAHVGATQLRLTGMAYDPTTSTLFGVTGNADPNYPHYFVSIDITNGACTLIGDLGAGLNCGDITITSSGQVYGWKAGSNARLVSINKSTGVGTAVGSATTLFGGAIQIVSGVAYVLPQDLKLYTVNLSTGVLTLIATLTGPFVGFANCAFNHNGVLKYTDYQFIYSVNTTTGSVVEGAFLEDNQNDAIADIGPTAYETTSRTEWKIGVYTRGGAPKISTSYDGSMTDEFLKHPTDCTLTYTLNGVDQLEFSLLLDDPAALLITKKNTYIRVWRFINDVDNEKVRTPDWETPDFVGVVTGINKNGENGTMSVIVQGVLWLTQVHFHIQNHRLVNDFSPVPSNNTGGNLNNKKWDHSALMWRLIDLINGAYYLAGSDTGIRKPPAATFSGSGYLAGDTLFWPQTIQVAPFYVQKGAYTWPLISEDLLARDGSPDIVPEYIYDPGQPEVMYFRTAITRGTDKTATVSFDYRTGQKNIENVEESSQVVPGVHANYVGVSGDGGPNGGTYTIATDDPDIAANGFYMKSENVPGTKLSDVQQVANAMIKASIISDAEIYTVTMSPAAPLYYDLDYTLGDLISLNADKGALQASDLPQRIYQVTLRWSDNNVESTDVMISNDFKRKFA